MAEQLQGNTIPITDSGGGPAGGYRPQVETLQPGLTWASSNGTPITTATDTLVVAAPGTGKQLRIYRLFVAANSATRVRTSWRDTVTGPLLFESPLTVDGAVVSPSLEGGWLLGVNEALYLHTGDAGSVSYTVGYTVEG